MKTRYRQRLRRFQLELRTYGNCYYNDRVPELKSALGKKPRVLQLDMNGAGEIPPDAALRIRSVLMARSPRTQVVTNALSSLHNSSVMVWLLGDTRKFRDDAKVYFRRTTLPDGIELEPNEFLKAEEPKFHDSFSEFDPEEGDYATVLQVINEFLPVKELAGRLFGVAVLRQFGLLENEKVDRFLATVFSKKNRQVKVARKTSQPQRIRWRAKAPTRQFEK